jgi:hypothetical protein
VTVTIWRASAQCRLIWAAVVMIPTMTEEDLTWDVGAIVAPPVVLSETGDRGSVTG